MFYLSMKRMGICQLRPFQMMLGFSVIHFYRVCLHSSWLMKISPVSSEILHIGEWVYNLAISRMRINHSSVPKARQFNTNGCSGAGYMLNVLTENADALWPSRKKLFVWNPSGKPRWCLVSVLTIIRIMSLIFLIKMLYRPVGLYHRWKKCNPSLFYNSHFYLPDYFLTFHERCQWRSRHRHCNSNKS